MRPSPSGEGAGCTVVRPDHARDFDTVPKAAGGVFGNLTVPRFEHEYDGNLVGHAHLLPRGAKLPQARDNATAPARSARDSGEYVVF